ncbi:hypothetical protein COT29_03815 [Candidatus Micrarchaeota archaeon CG08_land_8_20_14_0_20_59_11]|nr:MAG: hypothetical protein COT29_03815 [Candidatus Micrarchaeota archaeon CG08_land_8_20_14_0_20_59_11]
MKKSFVSFLLAGAFLLSLVSAETIIFKETLSSLEFSPSMSCWERTDYADKVVFEFNAANTWSIWDCSSSRSPSSVTFTMGAGLSAASEDVIGVEATRVTLSGDTSFLKTDAREFSWWVTVPTFEILVETTAAPGCDKQRILFDPVLQEYRKVKGLIADLDDCESTLRVRQEPKGAKTIVYVSFDAKETNTKEKSRFGGLYYYDSKDALGSPKKKYKVAKEFKFVYNAAKQTDAQLRNALCSANGFDLGEAWSEVAVLGASVTTGPAGEFVKSSDFELFPKACNDVTVDEEGIVFDGGKASVKTSAGVVASVRVVAKKSVLDEAEWTNSGLLSKTLKQSEEILVNAESIREVGAERLVWAVDLSDKLESGTYASYELFFKDANGKPVKINGGEKSLVVKADDEITIPRAPMGQGVQFCMKSKEKDKSMAQFSVSDVDLSESGWVRFKAAYKTDSNEKIKDDTHDYAHPLKAGSEFEIKDDNGKPLARGRFSKSECKDDCSCSGGKDVVVTFVALSGGEQKTPVKRSDAVLKLQNSAACTFRQDRNSIALAVIGVPVPVDYTVVIGGNVVDEGTFDPTGSSSTLVIGSEDFAGGDISLPTIVRYEDFSDALVALAASGPVIVKVRPESPVAVVSPLSQSGPKQASFAEEDEGEDVIVECKAPVSKLQDSNGANFRAGNGASATPIDSTSTPVLSYTLENVVKQWECYYYPLIQEYEGSKTITGYGVDYFFKNGEPVSGFPMVWDESSYNPKEMYVYLDTAFSVSEEGLKDYLLRYDAISDTSLVISEYAVISEYLLNSLMSQILEQVISNVEKLPEQIKNCARQGDIPYQWPSEGCIIFPYPLKSGISGAALWDHDFGVLPDQVFRETRTLKFPFGPVVSAARELYLYPDVPEGVPGRMNFFDAINHDTHRAESGAYKEKTVTVTSVSVVVDPRNGQPKPSVACQYRGEE